jgi:hypothetical protein
MTVHNNIHSEDIFYPRAAAVLINNSGTRHPYDVYDTDSYKHAEITEINPSNVSTLPSADLLAVPNQKPSKMTTVDPWAAADNNPTALAINPYFPATSAYASIASSQQVTQVFPASPFRTAVFFEDPQAKKLRRRKRRQVRIAASSIGGFVLAGAFLGPVGAWAGAVSGAAFARAASKAGERKKDALVKQELERHTLLV